MNLLKSLLKNSRDDSSTETHHAAKPALPQGPRLLLSGNDFAWLAGHREIAGRQIVLAATAADALALLAAEPFDGLVAGFRNLTASAALLDAAKAARPTIACALRADSTELEGRSFPHPVQARTQAVEIMDDQLRTMFSVAKWRSNPAFPAVLEYIRQFPALPALYTQITSALQSDDTSMDSIARLVSREPVVSAKLLQMVNSPVMGRQKRVTSIQEATQVLGLTRLRSLVLANSLFAQFDGAKCRSFSASQFEARSAQIAEWAAGIAMAETLDKRMVEMAFTAGLLHQFGVLLLAANLPEAYDQVLQIAQRQRIGIARVERDTYGVTHAELAGYILASWGIPFQIVNAVGWYSLPSQSEDTAFSALTAVHAANSADSFARTGVHDFDHAYLAKVSKVEKLEGWHKAVTGDAWAG